MRVHIPLEKIYERKADKQGRISLPTSKYANKNLEIAVLDTRDQESVWERREDKETDNWIYVWWHTERDAEVRVIREEPGYYTIQAVRGGHEKYDIDKAESSEEAYEKAKNWTEKNPSPKSTL